MNIRAIILAGVIGSTIAAAPGLAVEANLSLATAAKSGNLEVLRSLLVGQGEPECQGDERRTERIDVRDYAVPLRGGRGTGARRCRCKRRVEVRIHAADVCRPEGRSRQRAHSAHGWRKNKRAPAEKRT